jgi:Carboxypeptidase regulatory-like domain
MRLFMVRISVLVCLLAAFVTPALAQETVNYASVSGRVTDETGGVLPGASVTIRQTETNVASSMVTDHDGRYRFPYLRVGPYEITVRLTGFSAITKKLTLTVGAAFDLPVTLSVGGLETNVSVAADATVIETARSQIAGTVTPAEVKTLPLNGRNFLDIALLIPGVSPTNVGGGTQLFPETSAVSGVGLSVGSQRNMSNNFIVDGLSANDDAAALSGITYGVDAIDQFQVVTSGGQAELGRALGGYVNVVTKSGTNSLLADFYDYLRDDNFNAKNALTGTKLPMSQAQYGINLGGPVVHNRTFFFSNFEQKRLDQSGVVAILPENVPLINARLTATGYQGPLISTGVYPNPIHSTNFVGKIDHQLTPKDHFSVRYSLYDTVSDNARGAGGLNAFTASAGLDNIDQTVAVSNILPLTNRLVLETRGQFAFSDLKAPPTDPIGPAVSISGVASFGTLSGSPTRRVDKMSQIVNNLSYQTGAHAIRAGVDFLYNDVDITYPRSIRGGYTFSSLANFLAGIYSNAGFAQTFGVTAVSQTNPNVGFYGQDEWKLNSRLTVNVGLRYDLQFLKTINTDTNNLSPRAGFVWSPSASRNLVIRGSAGLFFDRVPLRAVANAILSANNTTDINNLQQIGVSLSPTQTGAPVFPNILPGIVPTVTLVNLTTMDKNLQNAYSRQASVEIERQIGLRSSVSVGYQHLRGLNLIMSINQNVPTCVASGNNNGCRPVSTYANNSRYSSAATSVYDGLHLSFVQRPTRWGSYRVSYTYSKSMNNVGEAFFSSPIDPTDINKDWGRSDDDQRHRFVVNGSINTPVTPGKTPWEQFSHGFQFSWMLQSYSALPYNITSGVTTIQGTAGRPVVNGEFIPRNAGVGSPFFTSSVRVSRTFAFSSRVKLEALAEVFNLTNHRNDLARNSNFGAGAYPTNPSSSYGTITVVGDPRSAQFGFRLRF